jgi:hypothetical protein
MDSALSRIEKNRLGDLHVWIAETFLNDALSRVHASATQILASLLEGERLRAQLTRMTEMTAYTPANTVLNRRRIAEALLDT